MPPSADSPSRSANDTNTPAVAETTLPPSKVSSVSSIPAGTRPLARADSNTSARTEAHAVRTAPPVMYDWREADDEPAEPTWVSEGAMTTFSTPSSVRAICPLTVTSPWPTSAAAVCTSTTGSPATISSRTRAVE